MPRARPPGLRTPPRPWGGATAVAARSGEICATALISRTFCVVPVRSGQETSTASVLWPTGEDSVTVVVRV